MKKPKRRSLRGLCILLIPAALIILCAGCAAAQGRTDRYDGFTVRTEKGGPPTASQAPEEKPEAGARSLPEAGETHYVVNIHTKRFHRPDCAAVASIQEKNRWDSTDSREHLLEMGYTPCQQCSP